MCDIIFRGFHPCDGPDTIVVDGEKANGRWVEGDFLPDCNGDTYITACKFIPRMPGLEKRTTLPISCNHPEEWVLSVDVPVFKVLPSTVGQYTNIDVRREAWPQSEKHKIFTGDMLGEWGEDENGNECVCVLGVVTYWEREGRYVLADENGFCNDWTLEDEAQPENWPHLIHCGTVFDEEVSR